MSDSTVGPAVKYLRQWGGAGGWVGVLPSAGQWEVREVATGGSSWGMGKRYGGGQWDSAEEQES